MSKRTLFAIAALALFTSFAAPTWAADNAPAPHGKHSACTEHVKKMKAMKTAAERDAYCKGDADCTSNHCESMMSHHGKGKQHAATPAPAPKTAN